MGSSRAEAVPPNKFKRFLTIASIAEMGLPGPGRQRTGASRQRSSREREPADKGAELRDPRVAIIQGWIWGALSKGGHYPRVDHGSTVQGWPLSKCGSGVHYPRVATIQGWPLSNGGHYRASLQNKQKCHITDQVKALSKRQLAAFSRF